MNGRPKPLAVQASETELLRPRMDHPSTRDVEIDVGDRKQIVGRLRRRRGEDHVAFCMSSDLSEVRATLALEPL